MKMSLNRKNKNIRGLFDREKMLLSTDSPFQVQEAFKTLRTNVMFSLPGTGGKCIGITSSDRSEGKSMISLNLAISLAQINKKVLVMDCDLRLPTIAAKLDIPIKVGLSNYLAGTEEDNILRIYHRGLENVDIVSAGSVPPDPTPLLSSQTCKSLIASLKNEYDYIILDFPPVYIVSDAVLLSDCVDGYLLVVRQEYSEYSKIDEMLRQMEFASAKLLGFVYNAKTQEGIEKDSKYYKYQYR